MHRKLYTKIIIFTFLGIITATLAYFSVIYMLDYKASLESGIEIHHSLKRFLILVFTPMILLGETNICLSALYGIAKKKPQSIFLNASNMLNALVSVFAVILGIKPFVSEWVWFDGEGFVLIALTVATILLRIAELIWFISIKVVRKKKKAFTA